MSLVRCRAPLNHPGKFVMSIFQRLCAAVVLLTVAVPLPAADGPIDPQFYSSLRWRMIGPFRAGRTVGAAGVPGQPNVFYIGVNNGGVWKTTDYGHVWKPIFDEQPTGSIGTLAVAPSRPDTIYVGSGEGLQRPDLSTGDGVYKSTDAGKTWTHLGLRDGFQIPAIIVDPRNPDRLFVAVLGHPYGANRERGVFRSTDGGKTFEKVLYKDENTGAVALAFDPTNSQTVYASLWSARQGPWENGAWQGRTSGFFKSTDGGSTWKQMTKGLPTADDGLGRIGFEVARSDPKTIYAMVDCPGEGGVYRSKDAGESWEYLHGDQRVWGRGSDFAEVRVDPTNKDVVYVANTSTYRSTDGGKTFTALKGAPGGDDYHTVWINPENPKIILMASDQGATITVNGGETWSSWYNQPTAQFYHVITDNQFPYWVYGGQQESGSAGVASRGNDGQITFREWHTVGVEEYGYVAPDPLHPHLIYGGKITRYDSRTGQVQDVSPRPGPGQSFRFLRTAPVIFSTVDPHVLYFAGNVLFKTTTGGNSWDIISPDLSREKPEVPASVGVFRTPQLASQPRRGVIYTVAPSYKDVNVIWAGTDDGLIHVTRDGGKTWRNVTPPDISAWSKISILDAGRFDAGTAYAAVNRIRCDDSRPHIYKTHDFGKTWRHITRGLPDDPINAVREDPVRQGLLFAGSERMVHVSLDDGENWTPLRLNMPATSIRDLVVHNDDVVVGTHGRGFWILDDISPLRQLAEKRPGSQPILFRPQTAYRVRRSVGTDTPLPPEEPAGQNPPDGAILDYLLPAKARLVTLEILDGNNALVRRYSSADRPPVVNPRDLNIATYWIRPPQVLSVEAGPHRFLWDMFYPPLQEPRNYPISAIFMDTPPGPHGPAAAPGQYSVRLTVDGLVLTQPLTVKMDPRVPATPEELGQQTRLSMQCYHGVLEARALQQRLGRIRTEIKAIQAKSPGGPLAESLSKLEGKIAALAGSGGGGGRRGGRGRRGAPVRQQTLATIQGELSGLLYALQGADAAPTTQLAAAVETAHSTSLDLQKRAKELLEKDVARVNEDLKKAGQAVLGGKKGK
jgi:photosystem II stability/assembly factor-like uncharacterized protein